MNNDPRCKAVIIAAGATTVPRTCPVHGIQKCPEPTATPSPATANSPEIEGIKPDPATAGAVPTIDTPKMRSFLADMWTAGSENNADTNSIETAIIAHVDAALAAAHEVTCRAEVERDGAIAEAKQWEAAYERARLTGAAEAPELMKVPREHTEHEDCNCEAVGYAKGWNALASRQPVEAAEHHEDIKKLVSFYQVGSLEALAMEQARHIERLQAKLPRDQWLAFIKAREG